MDFDLNIYLPKGGVHSWVQTMFYVISAIFLMVSAAAAVWRFKIFRMGEPAIRIDLEVRSYTSSPSYNALSAVALVKNSSRVETVVNEFEWEVRVLSPYTDEAVEDKAQEYTDYYYSETQWVEFPWNVNYKLTQTDARINLEPGESNTVSMNLAIPDWITAVDVKLVLYAPPGRKKWDDAWVARRTHSLIAEV